MPQSTSSSTVNDTLLVDFNLKAHDFDNYLAPLNENLVELKSAYELVRVLNKSCYLMRRLYHSVDTAETTTTSSSSSSTEQERFVVLKRLNKSLHMNLSCKSLVPFGEQRVPHMCQLLKYYESDNSLFLCVEYAPMGRLFNYLELLLKTSGGDSSFKLNLRKSSEQMLVDSTTTTTTTTTKPPPTHRKSFSVQCDPHSAMNASESAVKHENNSELLRGGAAARSPFTKAYFAQCAVWLRQLLEAMRHLHKMGIVCKDLRTDNLLMSADGDLRLTFISEWNVVERQLNEEAVQCFYVAPGIYSVFDSFRIATFETNIHSTTMAIFQQN